MADTLSAHLPRAQTLKTWILCMKCCDIYGNSSSPRALHKTLDALNLIHGASLKFSLLQERRFWHYWIGRIRVEKGWRWKICWRHLSAHVDDCRIACKSKDSMVALKKEILTCFVGTDEWEITEYLLRADSQPRNQNGKTRPEGIRDASLESLWNVGLQVLLHWMLTAGC